MSDSLKTLLIVAFLILIVWNLGAGCTYFGGGNSIIYPSKQQVVGTTLTLDAQSCSGDTLELTASRNTGPGECAT